MVLDRPGRTSTLAGPFRSYSGTASILGGRPTSFSLLPAVKRRGRAAAIMEMGYSGGAIA
jgi:hypothetical protein